ncbi:hypothetical protein [Pyrobaculum calidifontis]|uniref:Uncharacterized protein n=1 Tax=Pyrobaculum calidifontis (strain DSM 21063 / JCM 11548 / VA1) TaxID=410359 RepID=A3MXF3_PYRCJ|nr:hypothetical protein [Pyrobaculum calidifontis]ABO09320.1 conserved hypothetical protein [Pyrobaculum calidifontis JCM 11548]
MLFFLLFSEFLLNRTLNRFWIFVPQNQFTHALFLAIQWGGYIAMIALYVLAFAYLGLWGSLPLALVALVVTALDLSAAYIGVGLRLMPILPLVYALFFRSRAGYVVAAYYLAQGVVNLYAPQLLWVTPYLEWAWAFMPLVGVFISGIRHGAWKLASAAALATAAAVAASPYYMGMILVFGMGLTQPWLLPVAVFLSLLQRERLFMYSLLVGPQAQLSVHYLTLATAIGYVARGKFKGGAVGS